MDILGKIGALLNNPSAKFSFIGSLLTFNINKSSPESAKLDQLENMIKDLTQSSKNRVQDGSASEVEYIFDSDSFALVILSRIDWTNPDVSAALNNEGLKSEVVVRHINQAKENWLNEARNFLGTFNEYRESLSKEFALNNDILAKFNENKENLMNDVLLRAVNERKKNLRESDSPKEVALFDVVGIILAQLHTDTKKVFSAIEDFLKNFSERVTICKEISSATEDLIQKVEETDDILGNNRELSIDLTKFKQLQEDDKKKAAAISLALEKFKQFQEDFKRFNQTHGAWSKFVFTEGKLRREIQL